jgi:hypothetical protein
MAVERVRALQLLPKHDIAVTTVDSRCSNVYAPYAAMESMCRDESQHTHVFLGPSCEYALGTFRKHQIEYNNKLVTMSYICDGN